MVVRCDDVDWQCEGLMEWRDRNVEQKERAILSILSGVAGADALV